MKIHAPTDRVSDFFSAPDQARMVPRDLDLLGLARRVAAGLAWVEWISIP